MSMIKELGPYIKLYRARNKKNNLFLGEYEIEGTQISGKPRVFNMKSHAAQAIDEWHGFICGVHTWGHQRDWEIIEYIYSFVDEFVVG
jgi:hypothetical protein